MHASRPAGPASRTSWSVHTPILRHHHERNEVACRHTAVRPSGPMAPELLWIFENTWPFSYVYSVNVCKTGGPSRGAKSRCVLADRVGFFSPYEQGPQRPPSELLSGQGQGAHPPLRQVTAPCPGPGGTAGACWVGPSRGHRGCAAAVKAVSTPIPRHARSPKGKGLDEIVYRLRAARSCRSLHYVAARSGSWIAAPSPSLVARC
jgi:hypothetical protein